MQQTRRTITLWQSHRFTWTLVMTLMVVWTITTGHAATNQENSYIVKVTGKPVIAMWAILCYSWFANVEVLSASRLSCWSPSVCACEAQLVNTIQTDCTSWSPEQQYKLRIKYKLLITNDWFNECRHIHLYIYIYIWKFRQSLSTFVQNQVQFHLPYFN